MARVRDIISHLTEALVPLYGAREAQAVARRAVMWLNDVSFTQLALMLDDEAATDVDWLRVERELVAARPVQYVCGRAEFCGLRLSVHEGCLIPRPETEMLVDWICESEHSGSRILDACTGSGCIAVALASRGYKVAAFDIEHAALEIAAENIAQIGVEVDLRQADALSDFAAQYADAQFDVVVSNPPYIPQSDISQMHRNVLDYEPHTALFVEDEDALKFYRSIARNARRLLRSGGHLYFEIYELYDDAMRQMLADEGFMEIKLRCDMNEKPRMICCRK